MTPYPSNGKISERLKKLGFKHINQGNNASHFAFEKIIGGRKHRALVSKNPKKEPPNGTLSNIAKHAGVPQKIFKMTDQEFKKWLKENKTQLT